MITNFLFTYSIIIKNYTYQLYLNKIIFYNILIVYFNYILIFNFD